MYFDLGDDNPEKIESMFKEKVAETSANGFSRLEGVVLENITIKDKSVITT